MRNEIILTFNYNLIALHLWGDFFNLKTTTQFKVYDSVANLPKNWNDLAVKNIFLTREYLEILEKSAPTNMICHFIGVFQNEELVGVVFGQVEILCLK